MWQSCDLGPLHPLEPELLPLPRGHTDGGSLGGVQHLRHGRHQVLSVVRQHLTGFLVCLRVCVHVHVTWSIIKMLLSRYTSHMYVRPLNLKSVWAEDHLALLLVRRKWSSSTLCLVLWSCSPRLYRPYGLTDIAFRISTPGTVSWLHGLTVASLTSGLHSGYDLELSGDSGELVHHLQHSLKKKDSPLKHLPEPSRGTCLADIIVDTKASNFSNMLELFRARLRASYTENLARTMVRRLRLGAMIRAWGRKISPSSSSCQCRLRQPSWPSWPPPHSPWQWVWQCWSGPSWSPPLRLHLCNAVTTNKSL